MNKVIVITGADSGLGAALVRAFSGAADNYVIPIYGPDKRDIGGFDLTKEDEVLECTQYIRRATKDIAESIPDQETYRILINCAGINYIEWFESAHWSKFDKLMDLNVKAGLMLVQDLIGSTPPIDDSFSNWFEGSGAVLNIVSNASHMPMTNSVFYNASKGAFHIATLALARELRKTHGLCVFGISPNKLSGTAMSNYIEKVVPDLRGWTPEQAAAYQLGSLPSGEETNPDTLAEFIAFLMSSPQRHKYLTNTVIPYGA